MEKMEIPVRKFPVCINFSLFMKLLGKKYGWNYRDMAGRHGKNGRADQPYQDVWHWLLDNDFSEISNGSIRSISNDCLTDAETPDYVKTVVKAIFDEVKDHPALDGDTVHFWVEW